MEEGWEPYPLTPHRPLTPHLPLTPHSPLPQTPHSPSPQKQEEATNAHFLDLFPGFKLPQRNNPGRESHRPQPSDRHFSWDIMKRVTSLYSDVYLQLS